MILPDINVLVYAHRTDSPHHATAAQLVKNLVRSLAPFALTSFVLSGFLRIITNHRIFVQPSPLSEGISFVESLMALDHCRMVEPEGRHWEIFSTLLKASKATGNIVSDAYVAAIAVEHGCELLTNDRDFRKFPELKIVPF